MSSGAITEGITFVEASEVADRIQQQRAEGAPVANFVVIDVREVDEIARDGSIAGKVNISSTEFKDIDRAKSIVLEHKDKEEIVVHCLKSQQRGPTCALALSNAVELLRNEGETSHLPTIKVLQGGFQEFNAKFGESELVEK